MSVTQQPLFRSESVEAKTMAWLGHPKLVLGRPATAMSLLALLLMLACAALIILGTYARRIDLAGQLLPSSGLIKISSPSPGWIESVAVHDGDRVATGELLYVLNVDVTTRTGATQQKVLQALTAQRQVLTEEIARRDALRSVTHDQLAQSVENLKAQIDQTQQQIAVEEAFVRKLDADFAFYTKLLAQHITTQNELETRQDALMRGRNDLEALKNGVLRLQGQLIEAEYKLSTYNIQVSNEIGGLRAKIAELDQQVAASEAHQSIEIRAPGAGTVTALTGHPGQVVTTGSLLLTIVPEDDQLQAELLAPSRSIGFVRAGERVLLRYAAFPYQKFGQYWGTVVDVSHAALPEAEVRAILGLPTNQAQTDTFYRITVLPDRPDVMVYGRSEPLQASMRVEAYVLLDKRPLYQWIFEPLYGLHRNFGT